MTAREPSPSRWHTLLAVDHDAKARECVGWSRLKDPYFLKMFFADPSAWVTSVETKGVTQ